MIQDVDDYACMLAEHSAIPKEYDYLSYERGDLIKYDSGYYQEKFSLSDGNDFCLFCRMIPSPWLQLLNLDL